MNYDDYEIKLKIEIGTILKEIRKSHGLTQEQVAEKLGLAPRYLSDLERNKTKGSLDTFVKICNIYSVSPSYILKDYINVTDDQYQNAFISGYNKLNDTDKEIINELIRLMNKRKKLTN